MNDVKTPLPDAHMRHVTLDVIRGVAVMGILAVNIVGFALPEASYGTPVGPASDGLADRLSWLFTFLFFDGKMMGLFAMLFGASAMLMMEKVEAAGGSAARRHYARMIWLMVFGLVHLFLIWWGDILYYYSISGMLLYFARRVPAHRLMVAGLVLLALDLLLAFYVSWLVLSIDPASGPDAAEMMAQLNRDIGYDPGLYDAEVAAYRGSYAANVAWRTEVAASYLFSAVTLLPQLLGTMLVGGALYRSGFFIGDASARHYRIVALVTLPTALAAQGMLAWWAMASGYAPPVMASLSGTGYPLRLLMAVGYAALLILAVRRAGEARWMRWFANAGRMTFTNYIGTSLLMTFIFYGYGLSLFGRIERVWLWPFVIGGWLAMLVLSNLWLAYFRQGPLERLWRRLSAGSSVRLPTE